VNERLRNTALIIGTAFVAKELSNFAFNSRGKADIYERSRLRFGYYASEISGRHDLPFQAAHINHKRGKHYNQPSNGILVTVDEHLIDHILREGENGLTRAGNYAAIQLLTNQVFDLPKGREILADIYNFTETPDAYDQWKQKIQEALDFEDQLALL